MGEQDYLSIIAAIRAQELDPEVAIRGGVTLSIETCGEYNDESNIEEFVADHLDIFMRYLRFLPRVSQDLLITYYLLKTTQSNLGRVHGITQTVASSQLRLAVKALTAIILHGGNPSQAHLEPAMVAIGLPVLPMLCYVDGHVRGGNDPVNVPTAELICTYAETRNFSSCSNKYGVHRPEIRRGLVKVYTALQASDQPLYQALGSWVEILPERMAFRGGGFTKREAGKLGIQVRTDPDVLDMFRVNVEDPNYISLFLSKSSA